MSIIYRRITITVTTNNFTNNELQSMSSDSCRQLDKT